MVGCGSAGAFRIQGDTLGSSRRTTSITRATPSSAPETGPRFGATQRVYAVRATIGGSYPGAAVLVNWSQQHPYGAREFDPERSTR